MAAVSVTTKGQVTIPVEVRNALGIRPGTQLAISAKNGVGRIEVVKLKSHATLLEGAGMLKVKGKARSLKDFDAAAMLKRTK